MKNYSLLTISDGLKYTVNLQNILKKLCDVYASVFCPFDGKTNTEIKSIKNY